MSTTRLISVGPATLEVDIRGTGAPVVLLPGATGDANAFQHFAQLLNDQGYQTAAVYYRGASESTGPTEAVTLHDYAEDIAGIVDALEFGCTQI